MAKKRTNGRYSNSECAGRHNVRPPSVAERASARNRLGVEGTYVALRVGSPLDAKWSHDYVDLAHRTANNNFSLILVGVPSSLLETLERFDHVKCLPPTLNDEVFAHSLLVLGCFRSECCSRQTFGNVILEALACGAPVVYLARPFRDNTPWEFKSNEGFHYAKTSSDWLDKTISTARVMYSPTQSAHQHSQIVSQYGLAVTGHLLTCILSELEAGRGESHLRPCTQASPARPSKRERIQIQLLHNPLISSIKRYRLLRATS